MPFSPALVFMATFGLQSLAAVLSNSLMAALLGREWVRCGTLPAGDMLVASLAASRLCLHGLSFLSNLEKFFVFCYRTNYLGILWDFFNTLTFWLTAWLSVFYCVKISTFAHPAFFWLKCRILRSVPKLLLSSLVFSSLSALSSAVGNTMLTQMLASQSAHGNCTLTSSVRVFNQWYFFCHSVVIWFTPIVLFLVSMVLLMYSLHRHRGQMRDSLPGPRDPSTQAHTTALKSLAFFFFLHMLSVPTLFISMKNLLTVWNPLFWAKEVVLYAGLFLHSIFLMLSHPKIRKILKMRL